MPFAKSDRGVGMRERGTTAFSLEVKAGIRGQDTRCSLRSTRKRPTSSVAAVLAFCYPGIGNSGDRQAGALLFGEVACRKLG